MGKTTRPFRYDLNQIPYDYTVEVRNRFKGLNLIDRVPDELWMEVRDMVHSLKASILRHSAFFIVQLSHPYMTTGKTIALTRHTFVDKVMSLLFNMLSR